MPLDHTRLLQQDLLARIEGRLAHRGNCPELQVERAHLLAELGHAKEAAHTYRKAAQASKRPATTRCYSVVPYTGKALPITVLLIVAPEWGNAPFRKHLDSNTFLILQVIADFHDKDVQLPPHQLVINCISDADSCRASLQAARHIVANSTAPCINYPEYVLETAREANALRLASIPGVRAPKIRNFARATLTKGNLDALLSLHGFSFPLLARAPGFHTGEHFIRAGSPGELRERIAKFPGDKVCLLEFLDAKSGDGLIRKYRVMMIDGKLYPTHAVISHDWKVHLFSAKPEREENRREDQDFLQDMERVLGPQIIATLHDIRRALRLDYGGIDFSIAPDGRLLLFETNATMNVPQPKQESIWDYRRHAVQQINQATQMLFLSRVFVQKDGTIAALDQLLKTFTQERLREYVSRDADRIDLKIERAQLLMELGRLDESKDIYLEILTKEPTHVVALNNLGTLLSAMGYHQAGLKVYREVARLVPNNIRARLNLSNSLRHGGELAEARANYELALHAEPDNVEAHLGMAYTLMYLKEREAAWSHYRKVAPKPPGETRSTLPKILLFASPCGGNSPLSQLLDPKLYHITKIVPDFYDWAHPLPAHDFVINAVGDADQCGTSLEALAHLSGKTTRPIINNPGAVTKTGRIDNAQLLGTLEGVTTAKMALIPRETLGGTNAEAVLQEKGFTFPLLFRSPGFHEGSHFVRVEGPAELANALSELPGDLLLAIQYLDARNEDGKIRKYRVMMIDGKLYPLHKAVSRKWMIHYYNAEMADSPEHRAEDEAFLNDMPGVLGQKAMDGLGRIEQALGLEYAGCDFSVGSDGGVLLFEANATMVVPKPDKDPKWAFRVGPIEHIRSVVEKMLSTRIIKK